ncbi:patatin-like phospholipase family protein [Neotamlana laminarinivorans]|uniref:Patatin-like phospholipase family protein n=1 Tax=Neotamlana laminarinivorans TaxID=2883124 RepID=A0A9X1HY40_9FLAO|nr:patatin-like phospholipase family protein [Tamlana laminarinivorans]MCB4797706.1 patatin-like phospholipase family protein [Tamlana laminarinivorans]
MKLNKQIEGKKIGIVLSGGGVKGVAHVGILKALLENNIEPSVISGSSAGAIVGALYANGTSPEDMVLFFKDTPLFKYSHFTINKPGLFDTDKYLNSFQKYFPNNAFEALKKQLYVCTTNLQTGEPHFFSKGELLKPVLASAALPPVFSPVNLNNELHADGGIMNNFPIEPLIKNVDFIIGSNTSAFKVMDSKLLKNSLQLSQRANLLMLHANVRYKLHLPNLLFTPENLDSIGILDKRGIEKSYHIGYDYASKILEKLN